MGFRRAARVLLAVFFVAAGSNHFVHTAFYMRIVPPWLPAPHLLVWISGGCEVLGGIGVLAAPLRRIAGAGLIALLLAVFPANVQMALHPALYSDIGTPAEYYLRLPLQAVMIAWVWWTCLQSRSL